MKIIRNNILPIGHYDAINIFGVIFARRTANITPQLINHERIHSQQMRELLWVIFYILYLVEWVVQLVRCRGNAHAAYHAVSFEREAYAHHSDLTYMSRRRHYAQWRTHRHKTSRV
jgi:hypothetical protein